MKMLIDEVSEEVSEEGLEGLLGQRVTLLCVNYIYAGKLIGVNDTCVKLTDAAIVYQTGAWTRKDYEDQQKLPTDLYVQTAAIESFGVLNA